MNLIRYSKFDVKLIFKEQKDHWKLFIWMFLYALIPSLWLLVRTFVITNQMQANVETYAQWDYLNIMLEVIQETFIFPLFWWFGKIVKNNKEQLNKIKEVYLITFTVYLIMITILTFFVGDLIKMISGESQGQKIFFTLQLWSKIFSILTAVSTVIILNSKNYKGFLFLLIVKLSVGVLFDFTLTNEAVFSNNYIGLGLSTLLTEFIVFLTSLFFVAYQFGFKKFFSFKNFSFNVKKWQFTKQFYSNVIAAFVFSTVNNGFYLFMMAKNMNIAQNSDAYWLSNTIIWNWILMLPNVIFAINKSVVSTMNQPTYKNRLFSVLEFQLFSLLSFLVMTAIFIPSYKTFALFISNNNRDLVDRSWTIFSNLIGFFVFHILAQSLSSFFNAEGKNWLLAFQAIICNLLTFIPFIILSNATKVDLNDVLVLTFMFGISLMVSWIIAMIFIFVYFNYSKKI